MVVTSEREPEVFGAISHPARRRMLDLLAEGDRPVKAVAGQFEMSRPGVSQHLRVLLDAGLVTEQRVGRERRYRLAPERLGPLRDWIAQYERFLGRSPAASPGATDERRGTMTESILFV